MSWSLHFTKQAQKDAKKIAATKLRPQAQRLLDFLSHDPFQTPPPCEKPIFLWAVFGHVLYATDGTDACPPNVKHREAIECGLLVPLVLTANILGCIPVGGATVGITICILLAYPALGIMLLRSRTLSRLAGVSIALAMLSGLGLWCTFYNSAHSGG